jgi:hypothetical protein
MPKAGPSLTSRKKLLVLRMLVEESYGGIAGIDVMEIKYFAVHHHLERCVNIVTRAWLRSTFHVSTGRSASLKDQSNFSAATGSSDGSW